jgi:hypothetical protein
MLTNAAAKKVLYPGKHAKLLYPVNGPNSPQVCNQVLSLKHRKACNKVIALKHPKLMYPGNSPKTP